MSTPQVLIFAMNRTRYAFALNRSAFVRRKNREEGFEEFTSIDIRLPCEHLKMRKDAAT